MEEALQGVADACRLLEDLLLHEVAVLALADQRAGQRGLLHRALDRPVVGVVHLGARPAETDPVALLPIADTVAERPQRQGTRQSVVCGQSGSVRVNLVGSRAM